jgi:hypothetical protein
MIDYYNPGDEVDDDGVLIALLEEINLEMLPDVGFEYDLDDSYYATSDADSIEAARKADLRRRDAVDGSGPPVNDATAPTTSTAATTTIPILGGLPHDSKPPGSADNTNETSGTKHSTAADNSESSYSV